MKNVCLNLKILKEREREREKNMIKISKNK